MSKIVLIGPMGAGKSSIGRALASSIGWDFYDSDQLIEERAGVDLLWVYDVEGEAGLNKREGQVLTELMQQSRIVISTGGSTIADANNRKLIKSGLVIYLSVSLNEQLNRTSYSKKRPLATEDSVRLAMLKKMQEQYLPLYEELADLTYATDNRPTKNTVLDLISLIRKETSLGI